MKTWTEVYEAIGDALASSEPFQRLGEITRAIAENVSAILDSSPKVSCQCPKCAALCHGNPGWFRRGQISKAASSLGMSVPAFLNAYCVIEWQGLEGHPDSKFVKDPVTNEVVLRGPAAYVIAPRRVTQPAYRVATPLEGMTESNATCALLGPAGCRLDDAHRPYECAVSCACDRFPGVPPGIRTAIAVEWKQASPDGLLLLADPDLAGIGGP